MTATLLAYGRPFWPLFLHVLGAMTLFGAVTAATVLAAAAWARPLPVLARGTFLTLLLAALPAWVLMRADAQWIDSREGFDAAGASDPSWIGIGFFVADIGLLLLLVTTALAYWWTRSGRAVVGRAVAGLSGVYLALLALAWLAMSAKW